MTEVECRREVRALLWMHGKLWLVALHRSAIGHAHHAAMITVPTTAQWKSFVALLQREE